MKKTLFYLVIIAVCQIGCKSEIKKLCPSDELIFISKAKSCYDGKNQTFLNSEKEINLICDKLESLSAPINNASVNFNKGFVEVYSENEILYIIIFSEDNGAIIRYQQDYYYNNSLVNKSLEYLNMSLKKNLPGDCDKFKNSLTRNTKL
nr:hypothetical protein [uncultured Psychroserpens sp.]